MKVATGATVEIAISVAIKLAMGSYCKRKAKGGGWCSL